LDTEPLLGVVCAIAGDAAAKVHNAMKETPLRNVRAESPCVFLNAIRRSQSYW
jgi:hypothetical protein